MISFIGAYYCFKQEIVPDWVGYILGALGIGTSIYIYYISGKQQTASNKNTESLIKRNQDEIVKQYGFYPLRNGNNTNGFELFENKICDLVRDAKHSIKLCVVTPLFHSLRKEWKDGYNGYKSNESHWANDFCRNFITNLPTENKLAVDILFLEDNLLRRIAQRVPNKPILWDGDTGYKKSISDFIEELKPSCTLFYSTISEAPLYFALIDDTETNNAKGVMAFINCQDLISQKMTAETGAEGIANNLESFYFENSNISKFFSRMFDILSFKGNDNLHSFFRICSSHGFEYGMIAHPDINNIENLTGNVKKFFDELKELMDKHNYKIDPKFYINKQG
jgi:hypothetical protein